MRLDHGAKQNIFSANANLPPGAIPAGVRIPPRNVAKSPATQGAEALYGPGFHKVTPTEAAANMHNEFSEDAKEISQGTKNVPIHPACEGSDKQGYGGDADIRDPTGIGRGF